VLNSLFLQAKPKKFTKSEIKKAQTAKQCNYLNDEEKKLVLYLNLFRTNPKKFYDIYISTYIDSAKIESSIYTTSLKEYIDSSQSQGILQVDERLCSLAKEHATDMGKTGNVGHNSSDGKSFRERTKSIDELFMTCKENCQYGYDKGLDVLIALLIDTGVPNYAHRFTMLDFNMSYVGISITGHKKYGANTVMLFGGKKMN
jgi:hypothetical protein